MSLLRQQRQQQHGAREPAACLSRVAARPLVQWGRAPVSMWPAAAFRAGMGTAEPPISTASKIGYVRCEEVQHTYSPAGSLRFGSLAASLSSTQAVQLRREPRPE